VDLNRSPELGGGQFENKLALKPARLSTL